MAAPCPPWAPSVRARQDQRPNTLAAFMRPVPCCEGRWTDRWDTLWPGPSWWTPCRGTRAPPAPRPPGSRWRCSPAAGTAPAHSDPSWAGRTPPADACRCAGGETLGHGLSAAFRHWTRQRKGVCTIPVRYSNNLYKYLYAFFMVYHILLILVYVTGEHWGW